MRADECGTRICSDRSQGNDSLETLRRIRGRPIGERAARNQATVRSLLDVASRLEKMRARI